MKKTAMLMSELPIIIDDEQVGDHGAVAAMRKPAIGTTL